MGKKDSKNSGLDYLTRIGFHRVKGAPSVMQVLENYFDKATALSLFNKLKSLDAGTEAFYDFKNSNPTLSKALSEIFDGSILLSACNYIASKKNYIGSTILEVGCDNGYMTGFLALQFPNSKICAIDRCAAAIEIAKKHIESLGVNNVEFRHCSLNEVEEQFDTVISMRTMQENIKKDAPFPGDPLLYQIHCYSALTAGYTSELVQHIKPGGHLCAFERIAHDPLMCGWLQQLSDQNCGILLDTYKEYTCREFNTENVFQAFISKHGTNLNQQSILKLWYKPLKLNVYKEGTLQEWAALAYLHEHAGKLIRGVHIRRKGDIVGRFALFTDRNNKDLRYYLVAPGGTDFPLTLYVYGAELERVLLDNLKMQIKNNEKHRMQAEEIDPSDEWLEGNH